MKLGVIIPLTDQVEQEFEKINRMGFSTCQLSCWDSRLFTAEIAQRLQNACARYGVQISALWCGWQGPVVWDFYQGPLTLGLVPAPYRDSRLRTLKSGSDFARLLEVSDLVTHVGFLPENPASGEYHEVVAAIAHIAAYCKQNGQHFLFETGQETPVTLKRTIEDAGTGNLGINLDPANLILYGKANPVDALTVFGEYVRGVHAKDGLYPTGGRSLGRETPIGQGMVDFPALIAKLKELGYQGPITIEREISGQQQIKDILAAKACLEKLI